MVMIKPRLMKFFAQLKVLLVFFFILSRYKASLNQAGNMFCSHLRQKINIYLPQKNTLQYRLGFKSWILNYLSIRNTGNGELGLGALHLEPPSVKIFNKVAVAESCPVPETIFSWASVPANKGETLADFFPQLCFDLSVRAHLDQELAHLLGHCAVADLATFELAVLPSQLHRSEAVRQEQTCLNERQSDDPHGPTLLQLPIKLTPHRFQEWKRRIWRLGRSCREVVQVPSLIKSCTQLVGRYALFGGELRSNWRWEIAHSNLLSTRTQLRLHTLNTLL